MRHALTRAKKEVVFRHDSHTAELMRLQPAGVPMSYFVPEGAGGDVTLGVVVGASSSRTGVSVSEVN